MRTAICLSTLGLIAVAATTAHANPTINSLGLLPGGNYCYGTSISSNGSVVAGYADTTDGSGGDRAIRWTLAGGIQNLGVLSGGASSGASGISGSGAFIAGGSGFDGGNHAFRWSVSDGVMADIGELPGGSFHSSSGHAISTDGNTVVGNSYSAIGYRAFRWRTVGGIESLGELPGGFNSDARAVSADGSVVTGLADSPLGTRAFRWTSALGMQSLGIIPNASTSYGWAISADGGVIVGKCDPFGVTSAMRWTAATGMQSLGLLPGSPYSSAQGVSADGSIVVGVSALPGFSAYHGFMWTSALGMVDLNTYLPTLGLNLTGWTLSQAIAISADGTAITGHGLLNGQTRAWVVRGLPGTGVSPCAADLGMQGGLPGADSQLDNNDFIAFINYYFASDAHADLGVQGGGPGHDGVLDNNDFIAFIGLFFSGCG
jgi:probable HAF family extracellular repeat protein